MKKGEKVTEQFIANLKQELWCLHFVVTPLKGRIFDVVLTNERKEVRLAVLELKNGK